MYAKAAHQPAQGGALHEHGEQNDGQRKLDDQRAFRFGHKSCANGNSQRNG